MSGSNTPHWPLLEALTLRLDVDAFNALVPAGIVNDIADAPTYPAVRIVVRGKPRGLIASNAYWDCEAEIDVFDDYAGDLRCLSIADVVMGLIDTSTRLAAVGWDVVVMNVLDLYEVPDELINDRKVKRWTLPVALQVVKAST